MAKSRKHTGHFVSLISILGLGVVGILFASPDRKLQTEILILTAILYVTWGIVHHSSNHGLNSKVVIEYILIAALGLAALVFFLTGTIGI